MIRLLAILLSKENGPEVKAGALVAALGGIFAFFLLSAFADGEVRRAEMPLRALLGGQVYDELMSGEESPQHYMRRPPTPAWSTWLSSTARQERGEDRLAPDFALQAQDGSTWRLSEQRGKVVILNFWTVTCQPCIEEMPTLVELAGTLRGRDDVELVTISTDRDWDTVRTIVPDEAGLKVLLDPDRAVVRDAFGTRLYPETWVIDPEGVIRLRVDGSRDWSSPVVLDVIEGYL
jgi:peroxiredoxin